MLTDLSEMRRVAEAATRTYTSAALIRSEEVLEYGRTFDPPTVLALLDVVEAAKKCDHEIALWHKLAASYAQRDEYVALIERQAAEIERLTVENGGLREVGQNYYAGIERLSRLREKQLRRLIQLGDLPLANPPAPPSTRRSLMLTPELEAEIRQTWQFDSSSAAKDVADLLTEIDALRARVAALEEAGDELAKSWSEREALARWREVRGE